MALNPHQRNKIDVSTLSADEQRLFRLYGKLPNKKDLLQNKLKERKYFDSGDYALSKAGKASDVGVTSIGSQHPLPENIPHLSATSPSSTISPPANGIAGSPIGSHSFSGINGQSRSPVKEGSFLYREQSIDDADNDGDGNDASKAKDGKGKNELSVSPPPARHGMPVPIRRS